MKRTKFWRDLNLPDYRSTKIKLSAYDRQILELIHIDLIKAQDLVEQAQKRIRILDKEMFVELDVICIRSKKRGTKFSPMKRGAK